MIVTVDNIDELVEAERDRWQAWREREPTPEEEAAWAREEATGKAWTPTDMVPVLTEDGIVWVRPDSALLLDSEECPF